MSERVINVGFDFGTSTTKVCLYDLTINQHFQVCFDNTKEGLDRYCLPSILSICDGKVYVGKSKNPNAEYKLLKMKMMREDDISLSYYSSKKLKAYQLVAIYCACIISEINQIVKNLYPSIKLKIIYQFGVPIDNFNSNSQKEERFKLAFRIAEYLSRDNKLYNNKIDINWFLDKLEHSENEVLKVSENEQPVVIYPETIAGVAALLQNNSLDHKFRYSIVDIGAGTTDISYFEFTNTTDPQGRFHVYSSKTIDCGIANVNNYSDQVEKIKNVFTKGFKDSRELSRVKWNDDFMLLRLGGGNKTELKTFSNELEFPIRVDHTFTNLVKPIDVSKFPIPNALSEVNNTKEESWKYIFDLLAISYGLSIPDVWMPSYNTQVPPPLRITREREFYDQMTPDVG